MERWDLEEVARLELEHANIGTPVDPEYLVIDHGLTVMDAGASPSRRCRQGLLIGRAILVDEQLRRERRAFAIAHELAHYLLRLHGLRDTEKNANYLGAALLLPRGDFLVDLRRLGWDLIALRARHRLASFEALARRVTALCTARACIFDKPLLGQAPAKSYVVPYDGTPPTHEERLAAREAALCGAPVDLRAGLTAWPILEHDWHRVITLAAVENA